MYAGARDPASVSLPGAIPVALDITDPASAAAAADSAAGVTLLVNNAGAGTGASPLDGDLEKLRLEMDTHFFFAVTAVDGIAAGDYEILADELSQKLQGALAGGVTALYPDLP